LDGTGVTANILVPGGAADTRLVPDEPGLNRADLIRPEVMVAPAIWLASDASDGYNGHRFLGRLWDPTLAPEEAVKTAGWPINWVDPA
jgi:3-oxoacyl-[acyl-carrier protein] reductase